MKHSRFRLALVVVLVSLAALVHVVLSAPKGVQAAVSFPTPARASQLSAPSGLYAQAARALRQENLQGARQELEALAERHPKEANRARLLHGLYAYELEEIELAEELLGEAQSSDRSLEDWRLFLLAESSLENGHDDLAGVALERLLAKCPGSPLRARAYLKAAKLAREAGDERRTLALITGARREGVAGEVAIELEHLAWEIGREIDDDQVSREAGRRLLASAPLTANALGVADTFRAMDGELDWSEILSTGQVKQRARSFLSVERLTAALDTLDNIPEWERDFEWHLLRARVLTESGKARDALALLDAAPAETREERGRVEWEQAIATAELASQGRSPKDLLATSHRHLENASRLGVLFGQDEELSADSLRDLYQDFLDAGLLSQAMDALKLLRQIDPADTTGARELWERGWKRYRREDYEGAVVLLADLAEVYPEHTDAQRGRYWRARALEKLGREETAREVYSQMVAVSDTNDFYARRAMDRLGSSPVSSEIQLAKALSAPWQIDPALTRAKLLTDLGLDRLAQREMELVERDASPRDLLALRAIVLGRQGKRRGSIALLREAFPALGGPQQSSVPEEILRAYYPLDYEETIRSAAADHGLPPYVVAGIIRQESAFDARATSPVGARGLMQLMPATAREVASRLGARYPEDGLYDPEFSIQLGAAYFAQLLHAFDGNIELALASYNGGPNRIRRMWNEADTELDDFVENMGLDESRDYVKRILVLADSYRQLYPPTGQRLSGSPL